MLTEGATSRIQSLAQRSSIPGATLLVDEPTGDGPDATVYALDGDESRLCIAVGLSGGRSFRTTKAFGEPRWHTLRREPCGATFRRFIHASRLASCTVSCTSNMALAGSPEPIYCRGSWLRRLCPSGALCVAPSRGLLRHACQVEHRCSSRLFGRLDLLDRHHLRPDHLPGRLQIHPSGLPRTFCGVCAYARFTVPTVSPVFWRHLRQRKTPGRFITKVEQLLASVPPPLAAWNSSSSRRRSSSIFGDQAVLRARRRTR